MQQSSSLAAQKSHINGVSSQLPEVPQLDAQLWLERSLNRLQNCLWECLFSASTATTAEVDIFQTLVNELFHTLCPSLVAIALLAPQESEGKIYYILNSSSVEKHTKHPFLKISLNQDRQIQLDLNSVVKLTDLQQMEKQRPQTAWRLLTDTNNLTAWLIIAEGTEKSDCCSLQNIPNHFRLKLVTRTIDYFATVFTQLKQVQFWQRKCQQLEQYNQDLERTNQLKNQFLANTSHEIRTPLSLIIGFTHLLLAQHYDPQKQKHEEYLHIIQSSGKHLLGLIDDILDLSKIEANQMDVQWELVDVPSVCRNVLALVKEKAANKGLKLHFDLQPDIKTFIADSLRLKQMLLNLLFNAIKFTTNGSIGLRVITEDLCLHFTVWDTGSGISPEDQTELFKPYYQVLQTRDNTDHRQEGTGLGLMVTQKLAEMHGGSLTLESEVNQGSSFTIILPINPQGNVLPGLDIEVEGIENLGASNSQPKYAWSGELALDTVNIDSQPEILLVEDNLPHAELLQVYLQRLGYKVTCVTNAKSMWTRLKQKQPSVILIDVRLPHVNGLQLVRELRADGQYCSIPIIAQTAMAMKGDRELCLDAGVDDYISKPIDLPLLASMVGKHLKMVGNRNCED